MQIKIDCNGGHDLAHKPFILLVWFRVIIRWIVLLSITFLCRFLFRYYCRFPSRSSAVIGNWFIFTITRTNIAFLRRSILPTFPSKPKQKTSSQNQSNKTGILEMPEHQSHTPFLLAIGRWTFRRWFSSSRIVFGPHGIICVFGTTIWQFDIVVLFLIRIVFAPLCRNRRFIFLCWIKMSKC